LNSEFLKAPSSHCYQSTLVTVTFIGQKFSLSQSQINLHITAISNFSLKTGETIRFAENIASSPVFFLTVFDLTPLNVFSHFHILQNSPD